ncbi:MAG: hypothetical protein QM820_11195 [Minicystis sp.]
MFLLLQPTHRLVIRYHPEIGHLYAPHLRARIPDETGGHVIATNSEGFRAHTEFERRRKDRPRILFFGDSFTAGDGCGNDDAYPAIVGEMLGVETYNYGIPGTGTDQHLLILERLARDVEADMIVLGVYVENIERIKVAYRESLDRGSGRRVLVPKPYFTLEGNDLVLHQMPVPRERPFAEEIEEGRFQSTQPISNPLRDWIYEPLARYRQSPVLRAARALVRERMPWLMPAILRRTGFQPHEDYRSAESSGWRLMRALVTRFCERAAPLPVLIVPIPTRYFYHDGIEPLYQPLFEEAARAVDRGAGRVHVADATTPLRNLPWADKQRLPFVHDLHFTPFGQRHLARIIADEITRRGLIRATPAPHPSTTSKAPKRARYVLTISVSDGGSAACLARDGEVIAAAREEAFSRMIGDTSFPRLAINYCLEEAGIEPADVDAESIVEHPIDEVLSTMASDSALGPAFDSPEIDALLDTHSRPHRVVDPAEAAADLLIAGKRVGRLAGRMEIDPHAVGTRAVLSTRAIVSPARPLNPAGDPAHRDILDAVSARAPRLTIFAAPLAPPGEPVACTPEDAFRALVAGEIDALLLGDRLLLREEQPSSRLTWAEPSPTFAD